MAGRGSQGASDMTRIPCVCGHGAVLCCPDGMWVCRCPVCGLRSDSKMTTEGAAASFMQMTKKQAKETRRSTCLRLR
jgi:hypothetical protein